MDDLPPVCLITGGSSGIGLATAIKFAENGFRICICGRDQTRLLAAKQIITDRAPGSQVLTIVADLSDINRAKSVVDGAVNSLGAVNVLVNNAATAAVASLEETSDEQFESAIDLNIRSVFYLTRAAWRQMKKQGRGVVVNISSLAAVDPFPGFSVYGSTKAWLDLFTVALAKEGRNLGIRVFSIRPGAVETPMLRSLFPEFPSDQTVSPEEVAEAVWAVCQPGFSNSSGQAISVTRQ